jgi:hypothetical protein
MNKKMILSKKVTIILGVLTLLSCRPKEPEPITEQETQLEVKLELRYNGQSIGLDDTLHTVDGYPFQLKETKILLTQIKNGEKNLSDASKMDLSSSGNTLLKGIGSPTDFNNLQGAIGVIQPWNHADPVTFPANSPLNIMNIADMHWGWNAGYIFYKLEGVFSATPGSNNLNQVFTYHIGFNQYLKMFSWENLAWTKISNHLYQTTVYLHVNEIFNGPGGLIDLVNESVTHATPDKAELNEKISTNFAAALRN